MSVKHRGSSQQQQAVRPSITALTTQFQRHYKVSDATLALSRHARQGTYSSKSDMTPHTSTLLLALFPSQLATRPHISSLLSYVLHLPPYPSANSSFFHISIEIPTQMLLASHNSPRATPPNPSHTALPSRQHLHPHVHRWVGNRP